MLFTLQNTEDIDSKEQAPRVVVLSSLVSLRWFFLGGQGLALVIADRIFSDDLVRLPLGASLGIYALSNISLGVLSKRHEVPWSAGLMGLVLMLDTVLLTVVLGSSGGASNPFTVLYLVHITLSAVVLSAAWTGAVALLSIVGFGVLFLLTPQNDMHTLHEVIEPTFGHHLQGMWAAFVLATVLTAFFVGRISRQLAAQREQIATLRESSARNARVAALTTLAAGAAHELNSPLGTISIAAYEASRHARSIPNSKQIEADLNLILLEVDRCQTILHRLSAHASVSSEEDRGLSMQELSLSIQEQVGKGRSQLIRINEDRSIAGGPVLSQTLVPSLVALIQNGMDACESTNPVTVYVSRTETDVQIKITDSGRGISSSELEKVGDPFYTTKEPGAGLGLGVFLARALIESRGGNLSLTSKEGQGTCATVRLPAPRREHWS